LIRNLWPAFVWALIILVITGVPGSYVPSVRSFWEWLSYDKIVHVGVFTVFTYLILYGFRQQYLESNRRYLLVAFAVFVSLAYGLLTEVLQAHVFIGRDGNAFDFYADGLGAIAGWIIFSYVYRKKIRTYANTNPD
jgi:VanZ family protein